MSEQIVIDFEPMARATDPITSHMAASEAKELAVRHHGLIVNVLRQHGPLGKDGIAKLTGLESNQVARRLNEMKVIGLISLTGKKVKSNSGRNEREWTA